MSKQLILKICSYVCWWLLLLMVKSVYLTVILLFIGSSRSFFGHGQCQAGTAGDIIDGVYVIIS